MDCRERGQRRSREAGERTHLVATIVTSCLPVDHLLLPLTQSQHRRVPSLERNHVPDHIPLLLPSPPDSPVQPRIKHVSHPTLHLAITPVRRLGPQRLE